MSSPAADALLVDGSSRVKVRRKGKPKVKADALALARLKQDRESQRPSYTRRTKAKRTQPEPGKRRPREDKSAGVESPTKAKVDRPMTAAQRSELAALSRDPFLNFIYKPTLTTGEAQRLIPVLRKLAKRRRRDNQKQPSNRTKER